MLPLVKILSSRSTTELTLAVNQYLNQIQAHNENGARYSFKSAQFQVQPLPDLGVMYSVMLIINDDRDTLSDDIPF